jgi:hypothetical protein
LGWNSSSSSATALLMLSTGTLTIRGITIVHNSGSKGAILSLTGDGSILVKVWNLFVCVDYVL